MNRIVIIPARGGSKGIPRKNLANVGRASLIETSVSTALKVCDMVCVSSDSPEILELASRLGAISLERPAHLSGDDASSESAVEHALKHLGIGTGVAVLLQCTSPFTLASEIIEGINLIEGDIADSVFSSVADTTFRWVANDNGHLKPVDHPADFRPRRQELPEIWGETGAFYAFDIAGFLEVRYRFFGRVSHVPTRVPLPIDIDTKEELEVARRLAVPQPKLFSADRLKRIRAVIYDFDGVHTDNSVFVDTAGVESVRVSRGDGHGISRLRHAGYKQMILSKESDDVVKRRAAKLKIPCVAPCDDKWPFLEKWIQGEGLTPEEIAYIGNDENDIESMHNVGIGIAVADAHQSVLESADLVLDCKGGNGAIREFADMLLVQN